MFESFFGFTGTPFTKNVPLDSLYKSPALTEVLGRLQMTAEHQLFAALTAEVGAGKTTAIGNLTQFWINHPTSCFTCQIHS